MAHPRIIGTIRLPENVAMVAGEAREDHADMIRGSGAGLVGLAGLVWFKGRGLAAGEGPGPDLSNAGLDLVGGGLG